MEFAHIDSFIKDPAMVWNVLIKDMKDVLDAAEPNDAHKGLARLERMGILKTIITQNVDGLHQIGGKHRRDRISRQFCLAALYGLQPPGGNPAGRHGAYTAALPSAAVFSGRTACFFGEMIPPQDLVRSQNVSAQLRPDAGDGHLGSGPAGSLHAGDRQAERRYNHRNQSRKHPAHGQYQRLFHQGDRPVR